MHKMVKALLGMNETTSEDTDDLDRSPVITSSDVVAEPEGEGDEGETERGERESRELKMERVRPANIFTGSEFISKAKMGSRSTPYNAASVSSDGEETKEGSEYNEGGRGRVKSEGSLSIGRAFQSKSTPSSTRSSRTPTSRYERDPFGASEGAVVTTPTHTPKRKFSGDGGARQNKFACTFATCNYSTDRKDNYQRHCKIHLKSGYDVSSPSYSLSVNDGEGEYFSDYKRRYSSDKGKAMNSRSAAVNNSDCVALAITLLSMGGSGKSSQ
jgi:hypothetical protein